MFCVLKPGPPGVDLRNHEEGGPASVLGGAIPVQQRHLEKQTPVKLLLLADLHLGSRLPEWGEYAASRRDALRAAWHEAAELGMNPDETIDAMIVAGDLFDRRDPGAAELTAVAEELERLSEAGKPVVICPGAYDGFAGPHSIYESGRLPEVARIVTWKAGSDIGALQGRPVRLRFVLHDADVFSFRFCE